MNERRRGRPRRVVDESADFALRIWLTSSERRRLEHVRLDNHHGTLAETVREAINAYVADYSDEKVFLGADKSRPSLP